jgi:hypothetical protein
MSRRSPRPRQIEQPGSAFARTVSETSSGCAEPVTDGLQWHEWHATDASVLVVRGELDYWSGMELEQYLVGLAAAGHSRVVLDLAAESSMGTIWSSSPCRIRVRHVELLEVLGEVGLRERLDAVQGPLDAQLHALQPELVALPWVTLLPGRL